jgi:hypothetical protein
VALLLLVVLLLRLLLEEEEVLLLLLLQQLMLEKVVLRRPRRRLRVLLEEEEVVVVLLQLLKMRLRRLRLPCRLPRRHYACLHMLCSLQGCAPCLKRLANMLRVVLPRGGEVALASTRTVFFFSLFC